MREDVEFLRSHNLMDYSLLIGIEKKPRKSVNLSHYSCAVNALNFTASGELPGFHLSSFGLNSKSSSGSKDLRFSKDPFTTSESVMSKNMRTGSA